MMSTTEFAITKASPADRGVHPLNKGGREANRIVGVLFDRLNEADVDGARSELQAWLNTIGWRRGSNQELASLLLLLTERLGDLMAEKAADRPTVALKDPVDQPGREAYATSIHFSLLTAAVLRQREQIKQLMTLVESLSRRLA